MWLDRLAAQATSPSVTPPGSRAYSPAPGRRTPSSLGPYITSQQRPGLPTRNSSLQSLASNDSSASSLLASGRRPNGSNLKQTITAYSGPDPVSVLQRLLGEDVESAGGAEKPPGSLTEDDLHYVFDFGGLSLTELARSEDAIAEGPGVGRSQTAEECMLDPAAAHLARANRSPLRQTNRREPSTKGYIGQ